MPWATVVPVVDHTVRKLCARPYPLHPKGCPNFNKAPRCPGKAPLIERVLNLHRPIYAVWNEFDLGAHVTEMRERHPTWSERQLFCCLYWQGTARKQLRETTAGFLREYRDRERWCVSKFGLPDILETPEAAGVNVTATMARVDVVLEWPPRQRALQVVLAGYPAFEAIGEPR